MSIGHYEVKAQSSLQQMTGYW